MEKQEHLQVGTVMNGDVVTLAWNGKVESFTIGEMWAGMCVENGCVRRHPETFLSRRLLYPRRQQRTCSKVTVLQSGGMEDEAFKRVVEGRDECSKASTPYRDSSQTGQGLQQGKSRRLRS